MSRLALKRLRDKNAEIVLYSNGSPSHPSEEAARELSERGYTNVRDYAEGKQDWIDTGLPVESDKVESEEEEEAEYPGTPRGTLMGVKLLSFIRAAARTA
jgi:hypothetical protein